MVYETYSFSGKSINCYGLEIVKLKLKSLGHTIEPYNPKSTNTVLFSLYWPEQIYDFIKWRYKMNPEKKIIVGGNTATANPSPLIGANSFVYLGDGELFNGDDEYIVGKETEIQKQKAIEKNIYPIKYEDLQDNKRTFCEMSRGCKNKCLFCQYSWLKPYRESDINDLFYILKSAKTKSIRLFAADRFQHSKYYDLKKILTSIGKCDTGSDASLKFILKNPEYLKYTSKIRVGIEGMSYRLRKLVGKNYSDNDILNFCLQIANNGIKCLDIYMIYGLPTENNQDVIEFRNLLVSLDNVLPKNYTIAIHWNAFTPSAQTPFQWAPSCYDYDTKFLNENIFTIKDNSNIKLMHKPKLTSKWTILKRMLSIRAFDSTIKLLFNVDKYKKTPSLLLKKYKDLTGFDLCGEWPIECVFPWDKYVIYDKIRMKKLYENKIIRSKK